MIIFCLRCEQARQGRVEKRMITRGNSCEQTKKEKKRKEESKEKRHETKRNKHKDEEKKGTIHVMRIPKYQQTRTREKKLEAKK